MCQLSRTSSGCNHTLVYWPQACCVQWHQRAQCRFLCLLLFYHYQQFTTNMMSFQMLFSVFMWSTLACNAWSGPIFWLLLDHLMRLTGYSLMVWDGGVAGCGVWISHPWCEELVWIKLFLESVTSDCVGVQILAPRPPPPPINIVDFLLMPESGASGKTISIWILDSMPGERLSGRSDVSVCTVCVCVSTPLLCRCVCERET